MDRSKNHDKALVRSIKFLRLAISRIRIFAREANQRQRQISVNIVFQLLASVDLRWLPSFEMI